MSLYGRFFGGGAIHPSAQLAGSGVTVSGGAEKFPVAVNRIIAPFPRPLMVARLQASIAVIASATGEGYRGGQEKQ